jgi:hypothetical protein
VLFCAYECHEFCQLIDIERNCDCVFRLLEPTSFCASAIQAAWELCPRLSTLLMTPPTPCFISCRREVCVCSDDVDYRGDCGCFFVALHMCCYLDHSLLTSHSDSTVGSNPQGPRHMQLTAPDVQPVTSQGITTATLCTLICRSQIHAIISYADSKVCIRAEGTATRNI